MFGTYHKHYLMGLTATEWPEFNWTDITVMPPSAGPAAYRHWGRNMPSGTREPYQTNPPENCGVSNFTQRYGVPSAWGWSDVNCLDKFIFMCRINKPGLQPISYTNTTTGMKYTLNTMKMNFSTAEAACNLQGGHLVSYSNLEEQQEVENFFVKSGLLFPTCHLTYWMGLATDMWPQFTWLEPRSPDLTQGDTHQNWGTYLPTTFPAEPNQLLGDEYCGAANYTEIKNGAWGWADATCESQLTSMCKIPRRHRVLPGAAAAGRLHQAERCGAGHEV